MMFKVLQLLKITSSVIIIIVFITFSFVSPVFAGPQEDLEEIQKQLEELRKKKESLNNQINSEQTKQNEYTAELYVLKNKIDLLSTEIEEKELTIDELSLQIQILEEEITNTEQNILEAEGDITDLQDETDDRLVDMYLAQKTFSQLDLFFSTQGTDIIKIDLYQTSIQQETNTMLEELNKMKDELAKQKEKLEEDKIQVQRDEVQIQEEKLGLEKDKAEIDQQRDIYYRKRNESLARINEQEEILGLVTEEEKWALAEQQRLEQVIFDQINSIPSGSPVTKGTIIGRQGCTGYCTGPHLHFAVKNNGAYTNPCSVLPSGKIPSCGVSNSNWEFPMRGSYVLTSGYGWRWGKFHYGLDIANYDYDAPIYATHSGYIIYGFEPCSSSHPLCKQGGANYAIICENKNNCNAGKKTMYWHMR